MRSSDSLRASGSELEELELVPLDERWTLFQVVRLVLAASLLTQPLVAASSFATSWSALLSLGYVLSIIIIELGRRWTRTRALRLLGLLLLLDGAYLHLILRLVEPEHEWLALLLAAHIAAVTLLLSYRAGLKVTIWHTLLVILAESLLEERLPSSTAPAWLIGLWFVAIVIAACSALNERELRRGRRELAGLAAMARAVEEQRDEVGVVAVALRHVLTTFRRSRGAIVLVSGETQAISGPDGAAREQAMVDPLVQRCMSARVPLLIKGFSPSDTGLQSVMEGASNLIVVPLASGDEAVGVLVLEHGGNRFSTVSAPLVARVKQFADQAALALAKARIQHELRRLASADGLTGIANRRSFDEAAARELGRAERSGEEVSFLILDVDHFKRFNDTYGHHAGDQVLRVVASTLTAAVRPADLPARYGGEEFVVLLPGCGRDEAVQVAERVRQKIQTADTGVAPVTVSIGVGAYPGEGGDAASVMAAADEALYHSKGAGRNRVTHARDLEAASDAGLRQDGPSAAADADRRDQPLSR